MTDLETISVEEVVVDPKLSGVKSKIGEDDFIKEFTKLIKCGPVWRSSKTLADKVGVDPVDLANWMDQQPVLCKRPGKEDGTVYYALVHRLESSKKLPGMERKQVGEEGYMMMSLLHMNYSNFVKTLEKYALYAHSRNKEAFAKLVEAREAMSAGTVLIANTLQIDMTKLPKL